jgi:hypothetical protein
MAYPWVVDGGYSLQIWRVAATVLNKQSWTADMGGLPAWVLVKELITPHSPLKTSLL